MKRGAKCAHCSAKIPQGANYCHHCGRRTRGLHETLRLCHHCKKPVDVASTYCRHCGTTLTGKKKTSPLSFLLHLIVFLIILLGLFLLYTYPRPLQEPPEKLLPPAVTLSLSSLTCTPTAHGFQVCGKVSWEGGAYAKAHIPGGEELDNAQKKYDPFTYCQSVGSEEGLRLFRSFVYDAQGNVVADKGEGVSCVKKPVVLPQSSTYSFMKSVQFTTENQFQRPEGSGNVLVTFPDPVLSCTIAGHFVTDDGGEKTGKITKTTRQYCHDARGNFTGYLAFTRQFATTDADPFLWDSMTMIDPPPTTYESYVAYARTCDTQYLTLQRYFTSVRASGMGTPKLVLDWYYKNDDTHPQVNFFMDFTCQLRKGAP